MFWLKTFSLGTLPGMHTIRREILPFELRAPYRPAGDQPRAIEELAENIEQGVRFQTLLGVTGSGKTFTIANLVNKYRRPVLVIAPNKTLAAQL